MLLLVLILIEFGKMTKPGLVSMQQRMLVLLNGSTPENAHIAARNVADTGGIAW
jgi:hypothetical protein